jgi:hypothetical protein
MNDTMTNVWDGAWEDAESGLPMRGHGVEIWVMRGGKFAVWEAAFNAGRADRASSVAELLTRPNWRARTISDMISRRCKPR